MKIGNVDVGEFIDSVPVLRLFAKNIALSGGIAFIVQDFLIPLYSNYILPIVIGLMLIAIFSLIYWNFSNRTGKKFDHGSFQISIVLIILSIVITSLSSVSKAFSSGEEADRGILASNVKFIADLQGETNVYKEDISSLGRDISRLQSDLSNLSAQISSQISNEGSLSNEDFLNKISSLIDEKKLDSRISTDDLVDDSNDNDEAKEIKNLKRDLEIATELLKQVTLSNVRVQEKEKKSVFANSDSIVFYIDELKDDVVDLKNFSLQLLANTALVDTRDEFNLFKDETSKNFDDFKEFTSNEINEIKKLTNLLIEKGSSIGGSSPKLDNSILKEMRDLSNAVKENSSSSSVDKEYLDEITKTYETLITKLDNNSSNNDLEGLKKQLANLEANSSSSSSNQSEIDKVSALIGKLEQLESNSSRNESVINDNLSGLSELKYYIVELMKDQKEINLIVKDLREILEKNDLENN